MAKIFDITKAGAANAVSIAASKARLVTLGLAPECFIGTVIVKQLASASGGGTAVAYKVDILKSTMGLTPDTDIDPGTVPANYQLYTVMPQIAASAGAVGAVYVAASGSDGHPCRNIDGTQTVPVRKAYMLIQPTSAAGTTKWEYSVVSISTLGS